MDLKYAINTLRMLICFYLFVSDLSQKGYNNVVICYNHITSNFLHKNNYRQ
ncbi:hypothetical protein I79_021534 [Cricetulus griseus]|uniref:Uncharacterized protein n=1 Tax=Cricetulus griseus TaxID=10029 RepID=G3ICX9_CRIGR|nr:hypothetical protein I79_021534 [Cricetulus griseus]